MKDCRTSLTGSSDIYLDGKLYRPSDLALISKLGRPIRAGYKAVQLCGTPDCINQKHLSECMVEDYNIFFGKMLLGDSSVRKGVQGSKNPNAKLTPEVVAFIKKLLAEEQLSQRAIAEAATEFYGIQVLQQNVSDIKTGKVWANFDEEWDSEFDELAPKIEPKVVDTN